MDLKGPVDPKLIEQMVAAAQARPSGPPAMTVGVLALNLENYYAGQAMKGLLDGLAEDRVIDEDLCDNVATASFMLAEAMCKEVKRRMAKDEL